VSDESSLLAGLPRDLRRLLRTGLLSSADLRQLQRQLGILTTGDLALALEEHFVAHHGITDDLAARARRALDATHEDLRLTLGRALEIVDPLLRALRDAPGIADFSTAGSLRRVEPTVRDLRVVVACSDADRVVRAIEAPRHFADVRQHGPAGLTAMVGTHEVTLKISPPERFGAALLFHTGSREHLAALQRHADRAGLRLAGDGLRAGSSIRQTPREADVYAALGLPYITPELRQGEDEIEAAARGELPALLERHHVRGDLHMHTNYSDGRDSLEKMVATCAELGYEYIAITDHSEGAAAAKTVTVDELARQSDHIDRVQELYPSLRILKGVEVDILDDGRLDFPDSVLDPLDIVLASLHDAAGQGSADLLRRYRAAAQHPLVSALTHPANRLVGRFDGYDLDYPALFELSVRTGTALEVDGAPSHLDLDGALARLAVEAGVDLLVDSDCHHARLLDRQMLLGVGTARRGRVQPAHVINTRPLPEALARLRAKRR
jgi:DNA polymerase (family 10)